MGAHTSVCVVGSMPFPLCHPFPVAPHLCVGCRALYTWPSRWVPWCRVLYCLIQTSCATSGFLCVIEQLSRRFTVQEREHVPQAHHLADVGSKSNILTTAGFGNTKLCE